MTVYVVTGVDLGWDCVCGVFYKKKDAYKYILDEDYDENLSENELDGLVDKTERIIHDVTLT